MKKLLLLLIAFALLIVCSACSNNNDNSSDSADSKEARQTEETATQETPVPTPETTTRPQSSDDHFPDYNLNYHMSKDKIVETLVDDGFILAPEQRQSRGAVFESHDLLGFPATEVVLSYNQGHYSLYFNFYTEDYKPNISGPRIKDTQQTFNQLKEALTRELGEPVVKESLPGDFMWGEEIAYFNPYSLYTYEGCVCFHYRVIFMNE